MSSNKLFIVTLLFLACVAPSMQIPTIVPEREYILSNDSYFSAVCMFDHLVPKDTAINFYANNRYPTPYDTGKNLFLLFHF